MARSAQLKIDISSDVPAYRQIADQVRALVVEGVLEAGDSLPTVRKLALDLGIHFNTIAEAYRTLAREGLLDITHGHGARVAGTSSKSPADPEEAENFRQRLRELVAMVRSRGLSTRRIIGELRAAVEGLEQP
jgi:DNA-binding transcriptional regulator YhcF (GntR family)